MYQEPLFNSGVAPAIFKNFVYYFTFWDMYVYAGYVLAVLLIAWLLIKFVAVNEYRPFFPTVIEKFNRHKVADWIGVVALILSVSVFFINMAVQEQSVFHNFDTMTIDFIDSLKRGLRPAFGEWRFTPMGGVDYNMVFAVTNDYFTVNCYIVLKQLLCLWLLYKLFAFIPVSKRLMMLAVINFIPTVFWMNNVIFQEQNVLIFIALSLLALQKYQQSSRVRYLLYFLLAMNMAMYTKETAVLFYAGCGVWLVLDAIFRGKITFESFFHPLKTIKIMPVEWLMFWSMFVYSTCYLLSAPIEENRYISAHAGNLAEMLDVYKTELVLSALASAIITVKIFRRQFQKMDLLGEGCILGCLLITYAIVFKLRIVPASDYLLSYYLFLPAVFCTAYIFSHFSQKWLLGIFTVALILWSARENYTINFSQHGKDRRELAEFVIKRAKNEDMSIYLHTNQKIDYKWWKTMAWSSSFKYAAPDIRLRFKTDLDIYRFYVREDDKFFETALGHPEKGDYVLVNILEKPEYTSSLNHEPVFQNKTYCLYHIGG